MAINILKWLTIGSFLSAAYFLKCVFCDKAKRWFWFCTFPPWLIRYLSWILGRTGCNLMKTEGRKEGMNGRVNTLTPRSGCKCHFILFSQSHTLFHTWNFSANSCIKKTVIGLYFILDIGRHQYLTKRKISAFFLPFFSHSIRNNVTLFGLQH